jgi:hypothetical protein
MFCNIVKTLSEYVPTHVCVYLCICTYAPTLDLDSTLALKGLFQEACRKTGTQCWEAYLVFFD